MTTRIRPYSSGVKEHVQSLSSIILFTENVQQNIDEKPEKNFLTDFSSRISDLIHSSSLVNPLPVDAPTGTVYVSKLDSVNNYYGVFNNFSIMAVREAHDEIVKIHQNFDNSWNVFFFGQRPSVYSYNGIFIDSMDYPYYQEFMVAYDKLLAGRKCVENKTRMFLSCDGNIVEGYMLNISATKTAETSLKKDFSFSLLIRNTYWVRNNIIAVADGNGNLKYKTTFNGLDNYARFALSQIGYPNATGV